MAIILCPECKNKISSKATICPNCGCPIVINDHMKICKINGIEYDFTDFYNRIITVKQNNGLWGDKDFKSVIYEITNLTGLSSPFRLCQIIAETEEVPNEYNGETMDEFKSKQRLIQASKPKCPHCQSTNIAKISGAERAVSVIGLGILSKKINKSFKCKNCGYTW